MCVCVCVCADLETLVVRCMGYSLVIGTVSHEEAWSEVMPDIVQSFVKNMVRGREGGGRGGRGREGGRKRGHMLHALSYSNNYRVGL